MIVNSTDLKNNLGKYLRDCAKEEIIITSSGRKIAVLRSYEENTGFFKVLIDDGAVSEQQAEAFNLAPKKISYEEFLKLTEGSEKRYEYIDGEVYVLASPKITHQKALGELHILFHNWSKGKKCVPMLAPCDITLKKSFDNINVVQPDLVVICDLEKNLNQKDYYMGVPVLVVEIISESTRSRDTIKKLHLYMSSGVKEYWVINPLNREVTVYLFENNDIAKSQTYKKNEMICSYFFTDLQINLKDIFI